MRRLLLLAAAVGAAVSVASAAGAGPRFPELAGRDALTGKRISLAETPYRSRVVIVNVWASWCGGCIEEARDLAFFVRGHPGVALVGIDTEDSKAGARAYYRKYGFRHPSIWDPKGSISEGLGIGGIPTTFFLDRQHR